MNSDPSFDYTHVDQRRLRRQADQLAPCVERELGRTPGLGDTYRIRGRVNRDGTLQEVTVAGLEVRHGGVEACIAHQAAALTFADAPSRFLDGVVTLRGGTGAAPDRPLASARRFAPPLPDPDGVRDDLRATIAWLPALRTGPDGRATVPVTLADAVTGIRVIAEGVGAGAPGHAEALIAARPPLSVSLRTPARLVLGDAVELPVTLDNATDTPLEVVLGVEVEGPVHVGAPDAAVPVPAGARVVRWLAVDATGPGPVTVRLHAATGDGRLVDGVERTLTVAPAGFPRTIGATHRLDGEVVTVALDTRGALPDSLEAEVQLAPGPAAAEGLESLAREPYGCFEQTSATSYPNVLILSALLRSEDPDPAEVTRIRGLVRTGAERLAGFETPDGGFEWFGRAPGHVGLTAYGLVQLVRTAEVVPDAVDPALLARIGDWLLDHRDGRGGFTQDQGGLDRFRGTSPAIADAYVTWALVEAGRASVLGAELDHQAEQVGHTRDPYLLALRILALSGSPDTPHQQAARAAAAALAELQRHGAFPGAATSITRSQDPDLTVETTALAARALDAAGHHDAAQGARAWVATSRRPDLRWGATQATVLALEALLSVPTPAAGGPIAVRLDGRALDTLAAPSGLAAARLPLELSPARHRVALDGDHAVPVTVRASYRTADPPASDHVPLELTVTLADGPHAVGDPVRLHATVRNTSAVDQPSPVARIGLPAGLSVQPWQLDDLADGGTVAALEVVDGALIAYWDGLGPGEEATVTLQLLAEVAGTTTGSVSSAWPYYTSDARDWVEALTVEVARP